MRQDLNHLVADCGKTKGPSNQTRKWSLSPGCSPEEDGSPVRMPMRPRWVASRKHSGMRQAPLRRALMAQVGKPWNQIQSQIQQIFSRSTPVNIEAMWYIHEWLLKNELRVNESTGLLEVIPQPVVVKEHRPWCECTVCTWIQPLTGQRFRRNEERHIDDHHYARKDDGVWYVYTVIEHDLDEIACHQPLNTWGPDGTIVERSKPLTYRQCPDMPRWSVDPKQRRQANHKTLRRLGLRNDHPFAVSA